MSLSLSIVGMVLTYSAIGWYLHTIVGERAPVEVGPFRAVLLLGIGVSAVGAWLGPTLTTIALLAATAGMGTFILWLLTYRELPDGELIAAVGAPMPPMVAMDHTGSEFDLADLVGQRVLFKFFRGSW